MKKTIILIAAGLVACTAALGQKTGRDVLDRLENMDIHKVRPVVSTSDNVFDFNLFSHIGYGFNVVSSKDFTPRKGHSGNFFVNLLDFQIFPVKWVGLDIGLDVEYSFFKSAEDMFTIDANRNIGVSKFTSLTNTTLPGESFEKTGSTLSYGSLGAPVLLVGRIGDFKVCAGAEFLWNWGGTASYSYKQVTTTTGVSQDKAKVSNLSWNLMATMSYSFIGVVFKYYFMENPVIPAGGPELNLWTIGVCFGF